MSDAGAAAIDATDSGIASGESLRGRGAETLAPVRKREARHARRDLSPDILRGLPPGAPVAISRRERGRGRGHPSSHYEVPLMIDRGFGLASLLILALTAGCGGAGPVVPACTGTVGLPGAPLRLDVAWPRAVVVADLDGDGKADVATVGWRAPHGGVVTIARATGGVAPAEISLAGEVSVAAIAAGDVDGDGKVDLVVVRQAPAVLGSTVPGAIDVIRNLGGGAFAAPVTYGGGLLSTALALADVDGDGKLDILTTTADPSAGSAAGSLVVLKNQGDGTFAGGVGDPAFALQTQIAAADLDGDGHVDVAVVNGFTLAIAFGDGAGGFGTPLLLPKSTATIDAVAIGDLDGDGLPDLVTSDGGAGVSVRLNQGGGTFAAPVDHVLESSASTTTTALVLVDLDGDGKLDVAQADGNGHVVVRLNLGAGVLGAVRSFAAGDRPHGLSAGDLDGDGHVDLAIASAARLHVLPGRGDGTLVSRLDVPSGDPPGRALVVDYDGDGKLDLLVGGFYGGVSAVRNLGGGSFAAPVTTPLDTMYGAFLASADFDGDGVADVAVVDGAGSNLATLRGHGDGTFDAPVMANYNLVFLNDVAAGDLDGDGAPDLAIAADGYVKVLWNQGDGTFVENLAYSASGDTRAVVLGDFDGDGKADIVSGGFTPNGAEPPPGSVVLLRGSDGFATATTHAVPFGAERLVAGDLDGDGRLDLVVVSPGHPLGVMLNTGSGFADAVLLPVDADGAALADLDGDGKLDIVATRFGAVSWLRNTGGAVFAAPVDFVGLSNASPAVGDLDGDGRPDVVIAAPYTSASGVGWVGVMFDRCLP
jgi:hypothetical protein